jgi:phosphate transport system protein
MTDNDSHPAGSIDSDVPQLGIRSTRVASTGGGSHPPRETLDRDLRTITDEILRMGGLVAEALRRALQALVDHDADLALEVIIGDRRINEAQRRVSGLITTTIATQSPVARDLRFSSPSTT